MSPHDNDSLSEMEIRAMTHRVHTFRSHLPALLALAVLTAPLALAADDAAQAKQKARDQAFMKAMAGTTLTGFFSVVGEEKDGPPNADSYEISKVTKGGNFFLFHSKFGQAKLPPLPLRVVWAGTKPVITMDKITLPGMGTFSVHLLIDGNRYAGTWSHGETLGHMWGTIKKTKTDKKK